MSLITKGRGAQFAVVQQRTLSWGKETTIPWDKKEFFFFKKRHTTYYIIDAFMKVSPELISHIKSCLRLSQELCFLKELLNFVGKVKCHNTSMLTPG